MFDIVTILLPKHYLAITLFSVHNVVFFMHLKDVI